MVRRGSRFCRLFPIPYSLFPVFSPAVQGPLRSRPAQRYCCCPVRLLRGGGEPPRRDGRTVLLSDPPACGVSPPATGASRPTLRPSSPEPIRRESPVAHLSVDDEALIRRLLRTSSGSRRSANPAARWQRTPPRARNAHREQRRHDKAPAGRHGIECQNCALDPVVLRPATRNGAPRPNPVRTDPGLNTVRFHPSLCNYAVYVKSHVWREGCQYTIPLRDTSGSPARRQHSRRRAACAGPGGGRSRRQSIPGPYVTLTRSGTGTPAGPFRIP
jgi:hypothetical protein